jgi:hypothetical protein
LRKTKRLGGNKQFRIVRPGDFAGNLFRKPLQTPVVGDGLEEDEDLDGEQLPTVTLPPHEPLVLWTDPLDDTNKIEVS